MSLLLGGQTGNQSRLAAGLAASNALLTSEAPPPVARVGLFSRTLGRFPRFVVGITRDAAGAPLPGVTVDIFRTLDDVKVGAAVSDPNGVYMVPVYEDAVYYAVGYLAGAPDVAGTTVNTLLGL